MTTSLLSTEVDMNNVPVLTSFDDAQLRHTLLSYEGLMRARRP